MRWDLNLFTRFNKLRTMHLYGIIFILLITPVSIRGQNDFPQIKEAPSRPSEEADVIVESQDFLDVCPEGQICVEGQLYNQGKKEARDLKIQIEIGGTKHSKPRKTLIEKVDMTTMKPGDRQDFTIQIDRRIVYKDKDGTKSIEVGKYNFKLVPLWKKPYVLKPKRIGTK